MDTSEQWQVSASSPGFQATWECKEEQVKQARSQQHPRGSETALEAEGDGQAPRASQAESTEDLLARPMEPPLVHPKPGETLLQRWESEFQEFLEAEEVAWEERLLEELTPWADTKAFLDSFEQVAVACRWPRRDWVARLLPALSEEAEKAFVSLDTKDRADFRKVKAAILRREAAGREKKRQEFRRFCYQEANGPRELCAQLQQLCCQWVRVERSSKEQVLELLVLEQFLNVLPKEMQTWVRERGPDTCSQAVALAEDFLRRLEAADQGEEQEPEHVTVSQSKSNKAVLEMAPVQREAKKEAEEDSRPLRKIYPGYRPTTRSRKKAVHCSREEDTQLRARFPGRANTIFPKLWKQAGAVEQRRCSERLKKSSPPAPVNTPSPLPSPFPVKKAYQRGKKSSLPQEDPQENLHDVHIKICPECGQSFNGLASFMRHQVRHTGEKRYECCFCEKGFCWRSDLVRHECIHTGKKPHECAYCGEGFDRKWKRWQHEQVHLKGKGLI